MTSCVARRLCCTSTDLVGKKELISIFEKDFCSLPFSSNSLIEFQSNYTQRSTSSQKYSLDEKASNILLHIDIVLNIHEKELFEKDLEMEEIIKKLYL